MTEQHCNDQHISQLENYCTLSSSIEILVTFQSLESLLEASFQVHRTPFFRPKCLTLREGRRVRHFGLKKGVRCT